MIMVQRHSQQKYTVTTDLFALETLSLFLDGLSIVGTILVSSHTIVLQDAINHIFLQHHKLTQPPTVESNTGIKCATSSYTALTIMQWQLCSENLKTDSYQECYVVPDMHNFGPPTLSATWAMMSRGISQRRRLFGFLFLDIEGSYWKAGADCATDTICTTFHIHCTNHEGPLPEMQPKLLLQTGPKEKLNTVLWMLTRCKHCHMIMPEGYKHAGHPERYATQNPVRG